MIELPVTVVEASPFLSQADAYLSDAERHRLIDFVARHPEAGGLIRGTGGLRKLRWATKGGGKRGGLRLIYYFYNPAWPVFLLTIYRKTLRGLLADLEGGRSLVLLGSRGGEEWLAPGTFGDNLYELPGLDAEAASELADLVLEKPSPSSRYFAAPCRSSSST